MNKRFLVSVVVLFVVSMGFGFLVHGTVLEADYTQLANRGIYRSPEAAARPASTALAAPLTPIVASSSLLIG